MAPIDVYVKMRGLLESLVMFTYQKIKKSGHVHRRALNAPMRELIQVKGMKNIEDHQK